MMNMKLSVLTLALILALAAPSFGQTTRVAYVDINRVTENSDYLNRAMGNIQNRVEDIQKEIENKRKRLAELNAEIKKGEGVLASSELQGKRDEGKKIESDLVDLQYEGQREFQKLDTTVLEPMLKTIALAIEDVAKDKKIDLVLRGEAVLYGANVADITDDVVTKLNSKEYTSLAEAGSPDSGTSRTGDSDDESSEGEKSSETKSDEASESSAGGSSGSSGRSNSIIPDIPLRTRPVDRQSE